MPRASATKTQVDPQPTPVGVREDGAVVCKHPLSRGRCNKLVATPDGQVRCPNGHVIDMDDVLYAMVNRSDASLEALVQLKPQGCELRQLVRRLASPEFTNASEQSWQSNFLINRLDFLTDAIIWADHYEPESGAALREYWERELGSIWPDVASALQKLKGTEEVAYFSLRERALQAFRRWGKNDPLRYLAWSEVSLAAVHVLGGDALRRAPLYEHNIKVAARFLRERNKFPVSALLYLHNYCPHSKEEGYFFMMIPDPHCQHFRWCSHQIALHIRKGKWLFKNQVWIRACIDNSELRERFYQWLKKKLQTEHGSPSEEKIWYSDGGFGEIMANFPPNADIDLADPRFHLELMQDLSNALRLRMEHLIRSE